MPTVFERGRVSTIDREFQLLLDCCRAHILPQDDVRIEHLLKSGIDAERLVELAVYHGVAPLIASHLHRFNSTFPAKAVARLEALHKQALRHNMALTMLLSKALDVLTGNNIAAVPYKGPLMAARLYGNLGLRQCADVDLYISRSDVVRAIEALVAAEFTTFFDIDRERLDLLLKTDHEFHFARGNLHLELHWDCLPAFYNISVPLEAVQARVRAREIAGITALQFAPEGELLLLLLHGTKHYWEHLIWLCDIAELLRAEKDFDWQRLMQNASALRAKTLTLAALRVATELLDAPVPAFVLQQAHTTHISRLVRTIHNNVAQPDKLSQSLRGHAFFLAARDNWRDRAVHVFRFAHSSRTLDLCPRRVPAPLRLPAHLLRLSSVLVREGLAALRRRRTASL